ncbi:hypothetical protein ES703_72141 [subsurface metagenome]
MEVCLDPRLFHHVVEDDLGYFSVDDGSIAYPVQPCHEETAVEIIPDNFFIVRAPVFLLGVIDGIPDLEPVYPFLGKTDYLLFTVNIGQERYNGNQAAGAHTSEVSVPFNEYGIGAVSGGRNRGSYAAGSTADYHNIRFAGYSRFSRGFIDSFHCCLLC